MLDKVYTLADVVEVDYQIPGCPPSGETLWRSLQALLAGTPGELPYDLIKYD
jgi:NAD-reducing hydrogenase small subunit